MQTQQLICRNCKHFRPNAEYYAKELRLKQGFCTHPQSQKVDIITGIPTYEKAVNMRGEKAACGPVAILYEPETNSLAKWMREEPGMVNFITNWLVLSVIVCGITAFITSG